MDSRGNPVNRIDPTGLFWKEILEGLGFKADEDAADVADIATGFVPVAGEIADATEAYIDYNRGDYKGAAMSAAAFVIPFAGAKLLKKTLGYTADAANDAANSVAKKLDEMPHGTPSMGPVRAVQKALPGPKLSQRVADTFTNGVYKNRQLNTNETFYKYHGVDNRTGKKVSWFTNRKYASESELRSDLAIRADWGCKHYIRF